MPTPNASRLTSLAAAATFATLLALPGAYQLAYGLRRADVARWAALLRGEPTLAEGLRRIDEDVGQRFFLARMIRAYTDREGRGAMQRSLTFDTQVGTDGYLFNGEDFQIPRAVGFGDARLDLPTRAREALVHIDRQLKSRGVHLVVLPVPAKASIYPDKADPNYPPSRGPDLNLNHAAWFAALRDAGVDVVDATDAFWAERDAERSNPRRATYSRLDSHWTYHGAAVAAGQVAERIAPLLAGVPEAPRLRLEFVDREGGTDLLGPNVVPRDLTTGPWVPGVDRRGYLLDAAGRTVLADAPDAAVLVAGDSFAALHVDDGSGFPQALAWALRRRVRSVAIVGAKPFQIFESLDGLDPHVRVVVLEFAIKHLISLDWEPHDLKPAAHGTR